MTPPATWPRLNTQALRHLKARADRRRLNMRLESGVDIDPVTRMIRKGRIERRPFGVTLHLPKRIHSGNRRDKQHWSKRAAERIEWANSIRVASVDSSADRRLAWQTTPAGAIGWSAPPMLVRLTVRRLVKTERQFLDYDNVVTGAKPLVDALVEAGFLKDDSPRHVDRVYEQAESPDGLVWTVVDITAPEEAAS